MNTARTLTTVASRSRLSAMARGVLHRSTPEAIRIVNYHSVPERFQSDFAVQLRWYAQRFEFARPADLRQLVQGEGPWPYRRPAILLTFDDGLASHAKVVAPLLERMGIAGWFFVPTGLVGLDRNDTDRLVNASLARALDLEGDKPMMTWDDVEKLAESHVIGSHTVDHLRITADLSKAQVDHQVHQSAADLESHLGNRPTSFCWVGGEEASYSNVGLDSIERAGYEFAFMTNSLLVRAGAHPHWLQRTNVEAHHPLERVDVVLSGVNDLRYAPKRRRLRQKLSPDGQATGSRVSGTSAP